MEKEKKNEFHLPEYYENRELSWLKFDARVLNEAKDMEAISVTDLAKAVKAEKREQPQKKPSILKKLDEYQKQAAQQPKDKQKEHKKDWEV